MRIFNKVVPSVSEVLPSVFKIVPSVFFAVAVLNAGAASCPVASPATTDATSTTIQKQKSYNDAIAATDSCAKARAIAENCTTGQEIMDTPIIDAAIGVCHSELKVALNKRYLSNTKKVEQEFSRVSAERAGCQQMKLPSPQKASCYFDLVEKEITGPAKTRK